MAADPIIGVITAPSNITQIASPNHFTFNLAQWQATRFASHTLSDYITITGVNLPSIWGLKKGGQGKADVVSVQDAAVRDMRAFMCVHVCMSMRADGPCGGVWVRGCVCLCMCARGDDQPECKRHMGWLALWPACGSYLCVLPSFRTCSQ